MSEESAPAEQNPTAAPAGGNPPETPPPSPPAEAGTTTGLQFTYQDAALEQVFGKVGTDGRPENVAAKYWDADKKAIKADVVLNQLRWAESKIGKKLDVIGAPEEYSIAASEALPVEVIESFKEDPRLQSVLAKAKEMDLSETAVQAIVGTFLEQDVAATEAIKQQELAALGDTGPQRLKDLSDWIEAAVEPAYRDTLRELVTSAKAVEAVESLMRATQPPKFNQGAAQMQTGPTRDEWEKAYFARNERGERLVQVDPAYARKIEAMRDRVFGTERRDSNGRRIA